MSGQQHRPTILPSLAPTGPPPDTTQAPGLDDASSRQISPSSDGSSGSQGRPQTQSTRAAARRAQVNKFACAKCQKRKTKCDGQRPQCGACAKRNDTRCEYPVREGAMSRYSDLKETFGCLERENHDLKELLSYIRHRSEREAMEVWRRLRTAEDPLQVLQYFRDADTLLLIPSSSSPANGNQKMHELELDAQARSDIKVPSRPWTIIAGDGLVSCLISSFFKWDSSILLPFIDKDLFLRDMRAGSGRYCTPFLVNSICALRSVMSDIPRAFNRAANIDLCSMFLSEAKKQLDLEAGKVSYTSVQGLFILFVLSCCDGTNRAGSIYRMAAFDMLAKLKLEKTFARLRDSVPEEAEHRRAISKLLWGLYVLECLLSHAFLKPTTLSEPKIPRMIYEGRSDPPNLDVRGLPFSLGSPEPPLVPGATEKAYSIAILYQTIMRYNTHPSLTIGGRADMDKRRDFFSQLGQLQDSLPNRLRYRHNLAPDTLFLNSLINMAAYNIVRPLHPSATIREGYTAQAVILDLCAIDVEILELYASKWNLKEYSSMLLCSGWSVTLTLIPLLDSDPRAPDLFTRACVLLRVIQRDMQGVRIIMQGIMALLWKTGRTIPPEAVQYFSGLDNNRGELKDVPYEFALPVPEVTQKLLEEDDDDLDETTKLGADVAALLQKWSSLSVE